MHCLWMQQHTKAPATPAALTSPPGAQLAPHAAQVAPHFPAGVAGARLAKAARVCSSANVVARQALQGCVSCSFPSNSTKPCPTAATAPWSLGTCDADCARAITRSPTLHSPAHSGAVPNCRQPWQAGVAARPMAAAGMQQALYATEFRGACRLAKGDQMQPPTQVGVVQSCRLRISSWHRSHSCRGRVAQVGWVVSHPLSQTWSTS